MPGVQITPAAFRIASTPPSLCANHTPLHPDMSRQSYLVYQSYVISNLAARATTLDGILCLADYHAVFLKISPPFMTNVTFRTAVISFRGSPLIAMMSAA